MLEFIGGVVVGVLAWTLVWWVETGGGASYNKPEPDKIIIVLKRERK